MVRVFGVIILVFGHTLSWCQESTIHYARSIVQQLCSPAFDGRGYVDSGCVRAGLFVREEFQKLGLLPINNTFEQPFLVDVNTFPGRCRVKFGNTKKTPGIDFLVHPSSSSFRGKLRLKKMTAKEIIAYSFQNSTPKHAIAFYPPQGLSRDTLILVRKKLEKLAKTVVPVMEFTREKLTWSVSNESFKYPYLQCYDTVFQKIPKKVTLSLDAEFLKNYQVKNYFGRVASKTPSDSLIIVCAHYDHLGRMGDGTYFPGGNDNASGVAMILSLAREIQSHPLPRHNVLFIAFAGEEIGLEGSQAFVNTNTVDLRKVSMVLNLDILGSGEEGITVVNGSIFPRLYNELVALNTSIPAVPVIKSRGKAANSDHFPFSEKGVPALFIYTMGPNKNYHDVHDTYAQLSFDRFEALHNLFVRFLNRF